MLSPENKTYNAPDVWLEVEAGGFPGIYYVGYSLDGGPFIELTTNSTRLGHSFYMRVLLEGLYNGTHHLVAKADVIFDMVPPACSEVYFTMLNSKTPSPSPTLTPAERNDLVIRILQHGANVGWSYDGGPIYFYYEANKPLSWVAYSIDGGANLTLTSQGIKLPTLTNGPHGIKLYANSTDGQAASSMTYYFSIYDSPIEPSLSPSPSPSLSPTLTVSPILTPSESSTQQPPPSPPINTPAEIELGVLVLTIALGVAYFCLKKRKGSL
jgi:hypothetical protein